MKNEAKNLNFTQQNFNFLLSENHKKTEEVSKLEGSLSEANKVINFLSEQIRLSKLRHFGKKSETIACLSSSQLNLDLGFDEEEPSVTEELETPAETETITYTRNKTKSTGRNIDTSKLPREQIVHDLRDENKKCDTCGKDLEKIGEDKSEQLEYIPAKIKVIEHIRPKYTCRCCGTIKSAHKPESAIPKCMAGESLIAEVIIRKYEHHLPWYRQSKIFAQEGLDIPANTMGNWFMQSGEALEPLKKALWEQLNHTSILQADETRVKVLLENVEGYMWAYHSLLPDNRFIIFEYNDSRSGSVASVTLEKYKGILQSDGYSGYNNLRAKEGVINIGCWAHCRRKFAEIVKISSKAGFAHEMVGLIGKLYQIEDIARKNNFSFADRKAIRQEKAKPILDKIQTRLLKAQAPSQSGIGKAIGYALNQWQYLARYLDYGEAEIDNNLVENQIRPFALGRKNWLFTGNKKAADNAAFFYSIIQTCRINNIDARQYLIYVLKKAQKMRRNEIDPKSLLPQIICKKIPVENI